MRGVLAGGTTLIACDPSKQANARLAESIEATKHES